MNTASGSRGEACGGLPAARKVLVWDAPVRTFHWLMVLCVAGAYVTAESERWRLVHVTLGYTAVGLVIFRIFWGLVGTRHARFSSFVRGPAAAARYVAALLRGTPAHHTGHNPAGALAIVGMLLLTLAIGATGWVVFNDAGGKWLADVHEAAANLMMALVAAHIAGVAVSSWMHRENLVQSMVTGYKAASAEEAVRVAWRSVAALLLVAVLGFWSLQWRTAPAGAGVVQAQAASVKANGHDSDDD